MVSTAAICSAGSSTPSYLMIDSGPGGTISGVAISPRDRIVMTVSVSSGIVSYSFNDRTTGVNGRDHASAVGDTLQSATCLTSMVGGDSLAQFTKVHFNNCLATIGGVTKAIGGFGPSATRVKYVCVDSTGTITLAKPSSLSADLSDVKVTWLAAGP